jgi:transcriptional regulator with XRE-family HTH domain
MNKESISLSLTFGSNLRRLRKQAGMTISEFAGKINSDVGNLSRLERGLQGASFDFIEKAALVLSIDASEFFCASVTSGVVGNEPNYPQLDANQTPDVYDAQSALSLLDVSIMLLEQSTQFIGKKSKIAIQKCIARVGKEREAISC